MMTFKELKKLVKLPLYKEQRVPTVKALEESGVSVVAEKILENHGSISVYQNGYVIYRAHKRVTVFSLRNCVHYKYDALEGAGHHIEEETAGVTEELKACDPMRWVGLMNTLTAQIEEILIRELICS